MTTNGTRLNTKINDEIRDQSSESKSKKVRKQFERAYLHSLQTDCDVLPLTALVENEDEAQKIASLTLNQVYIDLEVKYNVAADPTTQEFLEEQASQSALACISQSRCTVLLGDPGSGKSTFVNHLIYLPVKISECFEAARGPLRQVFCVAVIVAD